ncbi:HDOD domain-containing protein [Sulfuriflexus sp.]|uniref:HDOD domain-containing protein n=1 Tax=Sulfuriflexus sp. TaxID=2015443 RepID=UPI0028CC6FF5|nr:HDOD domain-containing protein [Sulfuriflexus sp.]MDT8404917.1 HDOD domain-containing protein [Sulfuriflexus sp.]
MNKQSYGGREAMMISQTVSQFLDQRGVKYALLPHAETRTLEEAAEAIGASYAKMLRAVVVTDGTTCYMAVLPITHVLDFKALQKQFGQDLRIAPYRDFAERFACCTHGSVPPLGKAFAIPMLIDISIRDVEEVFFEPGSHVASIKMRGSDFRSALEGDGVEYGAFAYSLTQLADMDVSTIRYASPNDIKRRIEEIYELPAIPAIAHRILQLNSQADATASDLAEIVQMDPSLSAQTLRYASSPLFGYKGNIENLQDAIARVLGYDMVINMALGISIGRAFRTPPDGPLGMGAFWQHSVACAALTQRLARMMPAKRRPKPGMAYLTGLLHNFGFLLLGHLFQPEFYLLNKLAAANPKTPITELEQRVLGMGRARDAIEMGHAQMGAWLMEAWNMPAEVIAAVREHHHDDYEGEHAVFVKLVKLANHLLKRIEIGDETDSHIPAELLAELELEEAVVIDDFEALVEDKMDEVTAMARQMAA